MKFKTLLATAMMGMSLMAAKAMAVDLSIVSGATGGDLQFMQDELAAFAKDSGINVKIVPMPSSTTDQFGQYKLWLAAGNADIDIYQTDVIWAPQLADQFVDLTDAAKDVAKDHFPSIIQSQTVNGKLVAIPFFTDAPALYYRKDLLDKYKLTPPKTWDEMAKDAKTVLDGEKNADLQGFVFQGNAYEGLTCDALEWVKSNGGGQIVEPDGKISINNPKAIEAIERAKSWVGSISPKGVLAYQEEESRGVWQTGKSVFMRNWPYAYALGNKDDSAVKGKFDVVPLPAGSGDGAGSAATLGGWNLAVSKYSKHAEEAKKVVMFLASAKVQKDNALKQTHLPTIVSVYDDADVKKDQPVLVKWKDVFLAAVPRPSAPTKTKYNEVSNKFWTAVHDSLSGNGTTADNLKKLEAELTDLRGDGWK
ncbi:MAG: ABC transporter substrate-binding protein [Alphaproteobacteria bacterium]|nr:ABC transporter substrate-binding protein [Alphaproteobacteria bacterium]